MTLLTRLFIFSRDRFSCVFCGRSAPGAELSVCFDVPPERGGREELRNLFCACRDCASDKGTRTAKEYSSFLRWREQLLLRLARL